MAPATTDIITATSDDEVVVASRRRGKSKAPNFKYDGPVAVIRLELDASDEPMRQRLGRQWEAVFRLPARVGGFSQPAPATNTTR